MVLVLDAAMCFSCDPALAPLLDAVRRREAGVEIWLWDEPTREETLRLAAERINTVGAVPTEFRALKREALILRAGADGTVLSGTSTVAHQSRARE